jgi:hypothetical protein
MNEETFQDWKVSYTKALYETLNRSSWDKVKVILFSRMGFGKNLNCDQEVDRRYVIQSHEEDIVMKDADAEEEEEVQAELQEENESESEGQCCVLLESYLLISLHGKAKLTKAKLTQMKINLLPFWRERMSF